MPKNGYHLPSRKIESASVVTSRMAETTINDFRIINQILCGQKK